MTYQVIDHGVYRCLPTYDNDVKGLSAIVTGANGISGHYVARVLGEAPHRWSKVYCLSRSTPIKPPHADGTIFEHISVDFLGTPSEIATVLKKRGVSADYVFFLSYVQPPHLAGERLWSQVDNLCQLNSAMLSAFTRALELSGITPRRFLLQTGAKNYGGHIGPTKVPQEESQPRHGGQRNFYYDQEDILYDYCARNKTEWAICMPAPVLGAVPNASMTLAYPLAVYASVCCELDRPLEYPADITAWQVTQSMTSAKLNAYMAEWASLRPAAANQKFNTCDTSVFTWEKSWPIIASWYGIQWKGPRDVRVWIQTESITNHRGYGGRGMTMASFRLGDFMKSGEAQAAWGRLQRKFTLRPLRDMRGMFAFLDVMIQRSHPLALSMDKSRRLGWNGYVDTMQALYEVVQELVALEMIPPIGEVSDS